MVMTRVCYSQRHVMYRIIALTTHIQRFTAFKITRLNSSRDRSNQPAGLTSYGEDCRRASKLKEKPSEFVQSQAVSEFVQRLRLKTRAHDSPLKPPMHPQCLSSPHPDIDIPAPR